MKNSPTMSQEEIRFYTQQVLRDGYCVLKGAFDPERLREWNRVFQPLLDAYLESGGSELNRGAARYYVTLPFAEPFADPAIFENEAILAILEGLVGEDFVMCQLATDTPLRGSDYQTTHRDAPPLFPETGRETPPFQLAVNFPLVDVYLENGPIEIAAGTHMMPKAEAMQLLGEGALKLEPILMQLGDVMIRDVRGLHRGTPNRTDIPRPMVVIGYSRRWLHRPEVEIEIPEATYQGLSQRAQQMLRYNPVVDTIVPHQPKRESYDTFAY